MRVAVVRTAALAIRRALPLDENIGKEGKGYELLQRYDGI